ncbi:MAG: serine hydrolase domain-containing protein [Chitinophagaceae bacterium]
MIKFLKRFFYFIIALVILFSIYAIASGKTYLFKAVYHNFANIDDYKIFDNNSVAIGKPNPWDVDSNYNKKALPAETEKLLLSLKTVGLVVVQNNKLSYEKYWEEYSDSSLSGSFSVAKSITSLLIGCAIKEGKIKSVNEPVGNYLPEFSKGDKAAVTIKDVLTMSSGTDFKESYANPLSITTELYYGSDVYKTATNVKMLHKPGTLHKYKSGDTQLLGLILAKATGKSLAEYASEKLWQPLGAVHPALWSIDHEKGYEKAYCCFNSNAKDFARIGKLMLDSGKHNGVQIIDSTYWANSIKPCGILTEKGETCNYYGYQWWIDPEHKEVFYARGILGQYIICIPSKNLVLVRLGKLTSPIRVNTVPKEVRALIDWGYAY